MMADQYLARSLLAGAIALGGSVTAATTSAQEVQRVQVTGSRIPVLSTEGASPVTTLSERDVRIDGVRTTEDLLNSLPQAFAAQGPAIAAGATGTATVDLRHMGSQRSLVLVNGKRLPAGSVLGTAADLNEIPVQLIRRVDVLTGGAGAVYGSGAVAGVVNIILRDDFSGVELTANGLTAWHRQHNGEVQALLRAKRDPLPDGGTDAARGGVR
jgi:iron complex outermembrane receptor protein